MIREGRVFAYGNREQIVNNPEVRRHYIGERYDVGHLLEEQRPTIAIAGTSSGSRRTGPAAGARPLGPNSRLPR